jgi:hypothetical protein
MIIKLISPTRIDEIADTDEGTVEAIRRVISGYEDFIKVETNTGYSLFSRAFLQTCIIQVIQ